MNSVPIQRCVGGLGGLVPQFKEEFSAQPLFLDHSTEIAQRIQAVTAEALNKRE